MPEITETKLKEQITKEQIGSLYFLYGDEKLLVRRNLNRLLKKLDGNFPEFNFQEFPHDAPVDSIAPLLPCRLWQSASASRSPTSTWKP